MIRYTPIAPEHGLLFAWDGGSSRRIESDTIADAAEGIQERSWGWIHLDVNRPATAEWLVEAADTDQTVADALLAANTRPRCDMNNHRVVFVSRGVNLNPDSDPEDMVSVRMWLTERQLVSVIVRPVRACSEIADELAAGEIEINSPAELFIAINRRLADRMGPAIERLKEDLDEIYERIIDEAYNSKTGELIPLRTAVIGFHRHISPLSVEFRVLSESQKSWISDEFRVQCREITDRLTRHSEDLIAIQARAAVARDEIVSQSTEKLNQRVYVLTVLAVVGLPLTVLTGAFGMNLGGLPGLEHPLGFWIVVGSLTVFVTLEILILKWFRWI